MVKNQHLLGGLVVLGVINVVAFIGLLSGERDSVHAVKSLEHDLATIRDEERQRTDKHARETDELRQKLEEANALIGQLRTDIEKVETRLARTRRALEAVEERLDKPPSTGAKEEVK
jgi:primosomal protein N''